MMCDAQDFFFFIKCQKYVVGPIYADALNMTFCATNQRFVRN